MRWPGESFTSLSFEGRRSTANHDFASCKRSASRSHFCWFNGLAGHCDSAKWESHSQVVLKTTQCRYTIRLTAADNILNGFVSPPRNDVTCRQLPAPVVTTNVASSNGSSVIIIRLENSSSCPGLPFSFPNFYPRPHHPTLPAIRCHNQRSESKSILLLCSDTRPTRRSDSDRGGQRNFHTSLSEGEANSLSVSDEDLLYSSRFETGDGCEPVMCS
jgi:hypothetical protein